MPGNPKGDRAERKLVSHLDQAGYAVMRAPASGSATDRSLPDCLAGDDGHFVAIEAKYSSDNPIYLSGEEIDALDFFATNFGATALVAVRFATRNGDPPWGNDSDNGWRFFETDDPSLHWTDGGNIRVKKSEAYENGTPFADLFGPELVTDGGAVSETNPSTGDHDHDLGETYEAKGRRLMVEHWCHLVTDAPYNSHIELYELDSSHPSPYATRTLGKRTVSSVDDDLKATFRHLASSEMDGLQLSIRSLDKHGNQTND